MPASVATTPLGWGRSPTYRLPCPCRRHLSARRRRRLCGTGPTDFVTGGAGSSPSDPNAKAHFAVAGASRTDPGSPALRRPRQRFARQGNRSHRLRFTAFEPNGTATLGSADVAGTTGSSEADVRRRRTRRPVDRFQLLLTGRKWPPTPRAANPLQDRLPFNRLVRTRIGRDGRLPAVVRWALC